jgi:hypothetical protein
MSYGLKIIGNDGGGTFTVSDTELDILNLIVTDAGRAHSFTLPGGLLATDMIFVKDPSEIGGGDWSEVSVTQLALQTDPPENITFEKPYAFVIRKSNETISFWGKEVRSYMSTIDGEDFGYDLQYYDDWQVEFDYFVVRKASTIMADSSLYDTNIDRGLRIVTSTGEVSFDSRALGTNYNFDIVSYLPPLDSSRADNSPSQYSLTKTTSEYVNIEWTESIYNHSSINFAGLYYDGTLVSPVNLYETQYSNGTGLTSYNQGSLLSATLRQGGSGGTGIVDDGDDDDNLTNATGSLTYQNNSVVTEGGSITFNASTNIEGSYHVKVFQTSGSGNDLVTDRSAFFGDNQSITFTTSSPTSSRSVNYTNVADYIGTYTKNRISEYTRNVAGSFSRTFDGNFAGNYTGNFLGNYERNRILGNSYLGNYTGAYEGAYSRTRPNSYERTRVSSYERSFSAEYTRTRPSAYVGVYGRTRITDYTNSYSGIYVGNFTRNSELSGIQYYSRNLANGEVAYYSRGPSVATYNRTRYSTYNRTRQSTRISSYTRSFGGSYIGNYSRNYTRSRVSAYTRDRTVTYTAYYTGDFTRDSIGTAVSTYFRTVEGNDGEPLMVGYSRGPSTLTVSKTRYSTFSRTRGVVRNEYYSRTFVGNYTGDFVGNYNRTRVTNFTGNYARTTSASYTGDYIGNFTRTGYYTGDYIGNYTNAAVNYTRDSIVSRYASFSRTSTKPSSYSRDFIGNYIPAASTRTLYYIGNYQRVYARDFTRTIPYEGTYTGNFIGNFATLGSTNTFIGNYTGNFTRTGNAYSYTANNTFFSVHTHTSYDEGFETTIYTHNIKWNGTSKVINRVKDFGSAFTKIEGNDNIYYWRGSLVSTVGGTEYYEVGQGTTSSTTAPSGATTEFTTDFLRTRTASYSDGATYTTDFTSPFAGNYTQTLGYSRDYARYSTRTSTGTGYYASTRICTLNEYDINGQPMTMEVPHDGYVRVRPSAYSRTLYYEGNYNRTYVGNYTGDYTRSVDYAGNYTRTSTRTLYYSRNFARIRISSFEGNYSRTSVGNFAGNYDRTRITDYTRDRSSSYTRGFTAGFVGDYARGFVGEYTNYYSGTFTGNYSRNFFGNYTANFLGNYSRTFGGNYSREYTRDSTRVGVSQYSRTFVVGNFVANYNRGFAGEYVGNFTGNFIGDFLSPFTGDYSRDFTGNFAGNYTGNYTSNFLGEYTGNYAGNFSREFAGNYSRDFIGNYTGAYEGTYNRTSTTSDSFIGNYERTRITDFTITSTRSRPSSYLNSFGGSYERTFVGDYTGNYIGNYTRTGTGSQEDSEIGWQGETFVAELRTGNTTSAMSEPRGSSNVELLDSKSFTLYDNDIGVIFSTTQNVVHHTATTHTVTFDFRTEGDQAVQGRIYNDGLVLLKSFTLQNANEVQNVIVSHVPSEGQTKQYTIGFYNGSQWLNSGEYTVTKVSSTATDSSTPTYTATPTYTPTFTPTFTAENIGLE